MDREFEKYEKFLSNIFCNFTAAREHVPVAKKKICTINEKVRGTINILPYAKEPSRMIIELLYNIFLWLNIMPSNIGISKIYSSREILAGIIWVLKSTVDFVFEHMLRYMMSQNP